MTERDPDRRRDQPAGQIKKGVVQRSTVPLESAPGSVNPCTRASVCHGGMVTRWQYLIIQSYFVITRRAVA
jgi:hypothetical protein